MSLLKLFTKIPKEEIPQDIKDMFCTVKTLLLGGYAIIITTYLIFQPQMDFYGHKFKDFCVPPVSSCEK